MSEITYSKNGDYFIPEIALSEQETKPLGKYGRLRRTYLQEHRQALFNHLVLSEKLFVHLNKVDEQAEYLLDTMIPPIAKAAGVTEQLKVADQIRWDDKSKDWFGLEYCATPEDLQEELISSYRMNEVEKITKARRELTEEEIQAINENCNKLLALCEI